MFLEIGISSWLLRLTIDPNLLSSAVYCKYIHEADLSVQNKNLLLEKKMELPCRGESLI